MFDEVCLTWFLLWVIMAAVGSAWVIVRDIAERILRDEDYTDCQGG